MSVAKATRTETTRGEPESLPSQGSKKQPRQPELPFRGVRRRSLPRPESSSRSDIQMAAAKAALDFSTNRGSFNQDKTGMETGSGSDIWWGIGEDMLSFFENVKYAPLQSPLSLEAVAGELFSDQVIDNNEFFFSSCFER
ncbi:hypothetical protein HHK36_004584 [Tetracentron sinense]|uniref:Uncharacterized protein n=1 Tax=Tetracentron sinense TaxID=13715 RepID=A0A835DTB7_TETSI|nr:hypothetical protein HHK36_004584 [Tetracentron sinense]